MLCISKFHVIEAQARVIRLRLLEGPNAGNQIAVCAFHSFFVEGQTKLGKYVPCIRNSNLEIRIAGSS